MFIATVSNSCQSEDSVETSSLSDLEYKDKLEKLVTLGKPIDLKTSKIDLSNALKFKNYEEAYNYFKNNREFASDTITTELKGFPLLGNTSKTAKLESISSINGPIYGSDILYYSQVVNDNATVSNSSITAIVNANYHFNCSVQYAYKKENSNSTKNYYSVNVSSSNVSSLTTAFSGVSAIVPSGALAVSGNQGNFLSWTQYYQQAVAVDPDLGLGYQFIIEVRGSVEIRPSYWGSGINPLYISHFITARYL